MLHGGPASVDWLISVNSSEANYKTLREESNRRNEYFFDFFSLSAAQRGRGPGGSFYQSTMQFDRVNCELFGVYC
jgi:hypothetical protein